MFDTQNPPILLPSDPLESELQQAFKIGALPLDFTLTMAFKALRPKAPLPPSRYDLRRIAKVLRSHGFPSRQRRRSGKGSPEIVWSRPTLKVAPDRPLRLLNRDGYLDQTIHAYIADHLDEAQRNGFHMRDILEHVDPERDMNVADTQYMANLLRAWGCTPKIVNRRAIEGGRQRRWFPSRQPGLYARGDTAEDLGLDLIR